MDIPSEKTALADAPSPAWPRTQGEVAALVDAYAGRLVRYAFRQLGDFQDGEDVVQQVFVRTLVDPAHRKQASAVVPYLYRSVANACTDLLRKRTCAAALREEIGNEPIRVGVDDPAEIAQAAEGLRRRRIAVGSLARRAGRSDPFAGFRRPAAERDGRSAGLSAEYRQFPAALWLPKTPPPGRTKSGSENDELPRMSKPFRQSARRRAERDRRGGAGRALGEVCRTAPGNMPRLERWRRC